MVFTLTVGPSAVPVLVSTMVPTSSWVAPAYTRMGTEEDEKPGMEARSSQSSYRMSLPPEGGTRAFLLLTIRSESAWLASRSMELRPSSN